MDIEVKNYIDEKIDEIKRHLNIVFLDISSQIGKDYCEVKEKVEDALQISQLAQRDLIHVQKCLAVLQSIPSQIEGLQMEEKELWESNKNLRHAMTQQEAIRAQIEANKSSPAFKAINQRFQQRDP